MNRILLGVALTALLAIASPTIGTALAEAGIDLSPWSEPKAWVQTQKIIPDDAYDAEPDHSFARFGASLGTDGERVIVSAPGVNYAYILEHDGHAWEQTGTAGGYNRLMSSVSSVDDVAIHGDTVVIGASALNWTRDLPQAGAAYIFEEADGGTWEKAAYLEENPEPYEGFGQSVSIWEDTVVVGAPGKGSTQKNTGSIFIYERNETGWALTDRFDGADTNGFLGRTVVIHEDIILAAATHADPRMYNGGIVHTYERTVNGWEQAQILAPPIPTQSFGFSMDYDGTNLIIGAAYSDQLRGHQVHDTAAFGKAFIYERTTHGWELRANLDNPVPIPRDPFGQGFGGERFGTSVSIDGDLAVVGATSEPRNSGSLDVYRYAPNGTADLQEGCWEFTQRLFHEKRGTGDRLGRSALVVDDHILGGAPLETTRPDGLFYPANGITDAVRILAGGEPATRTHGSVYAFDPLPLEANI